jgi:hypothetical protein
VGAGFRGNESASPPYAENAGNSKINGAKFRLQGTMTCNNVEKRNTSEA